MNTPWGYDEPKTEIGKDIDKCLEVVANLEERVVALFEGVWNMQKTVDNIEFGNREFGEFEA